MSKILVIGSVALDTIASPFGYSKEILGGSATYFSISASFFAPVNLVATVGVDFPEGHKKTIRSFGVDLEGLETKEGKTFRWEGSYIKDMNCAETIETQLNVFAEFKPCLPKGYETSKYIFLANIDPDLQIFILKRFAGKRFIGCDSMNHWIKNKNRSLKNMIKRTSIIFLNDLEAKMLSGESNILKAGKYLLSLGPRFAVVKRGEYGAILFSKNFTFMTPAYLLEEVKDPTGAGDTFAGGFMGYLAKTDKINEKNMKNALLWGSVMASFTVQDFSINRFLKIKRKNIEDRYRDFKELTRA
ncbi:MAG: sugar kinase [Omnitrophica bacterium GWA2_41_15]|nr:MAG: sugar kinase [Omnitrophica bacterium GWA2_41_15]HAZ11085.1 sugar kinase [Candidatus Omnitrophota bacterium]